MIAHRVMLVLLIVLAAVNVAFSVANAVAAVQGAGSAASARAVMCLAIATALVGAYLYLRRSVRSVEAENARIKAKYQ